MGNKGRSPETPAETPKAGPIETKSNIPEANPRTEAVQDTHRKLRAAQEAILDPKTDAKDKLTHGLNAIKEIAVNAPGAMKDAGLDMAGETMVAFEDIKERAKKGDVLGIITEHPKIAAVLGWTGLSWLSGKILSVFTGEEPEGLWEKFKRTVITGTGLEFMAKVIDKYSDHSKDKPKEGEKPAETDGTKSTDPEPNAPKEKDAPLALKDIPKGNILNVTRKIAQPNGQPVELTLTPENIVLNGNTYVMRRSLGMLEKGVLGTNQDAVPITIQNADWNGKEISVSAVAKYKKKDGSPAERKDTGTLDAASVAQILEKSGQKSFKVDKFEFVLTV